MVTPAKAPDSKNAARQLAEMALWGARLIATPNDYKTHGMYRNGFKREHALRFLSGPRAEPILKSLNREPELFLDKVQFGEHFRTLDLPVPETLATIGESFRGIPCLGAADEVESFVLANRKTPFVIKPRRESQGQGVRVITDLAGGGPTAQALFSNGTSELISKIAADCSTPGTSWVIQRRVQQHELLDSLNSSSLNTIRVGTYRKKNGLVDIEFAVLRLGSSSSQIDAYNAGGVSVRIDPETGAFARTGRKKSKYSLGEVHNHPDSGVEFSGLTIPNWDQVKKLAIEFAANAKDNRFVGWDVAISKNGPIFIEGNHAWDVQHAQLDSEGMLTPYFVSRLETDAGIVIDPGTPPPFKPFKASALLLR